MEKVINNLGLFRSFVAYNLSAQTIDRLSLLSQNQIFRCPSYIFKRNRKASPVEQFQTALLFTYHAKMTSPIHFVAMIGMIFLCISTNAAEASLRGRDTSVRGPRQFECPTETPAIGSRCQVADEDELPTCYFSFVMTPGPSQDINNFVPSISCSCTNSHWDCGIAPEYLKALVEAASG
jgi:hypothetical protein